MNQLGAGALISGLSIPLSAATGSEKAESSKNSEAVQHMVIFVLKHDKGSLAEAKFLSDARTILSKIPVVKEFRVLDQVNVKNDYHFGFSMVFANQMAYDTYNHNPDHLAFVEKRWKKEVARFLEIDFKVH
ncbi:MAG: Dabb family protein [bacterium]